MTNGIPSSHSPLPAANPSPSPAATASATASTPPAASPGPSATQLPGTSATPPSTDGSKKPGKPERKKRGGGLFAGLFGLIGGFFKMLFGGGRSKKPKQNSNKN
jgi:hypothetical protein